MSRFSLEKHITDVLICKTLLTQQRKISSKAYKCLCIVFRSWGSGGGDRGGQPHRGKGPKSGSGGGGGKNNNNHHHHHRPNPLSLHPNKGEHTYMTSTASVGPYVHRKLKEGGSPKASRCGGIQTLKVKVGHFRILKKLKTK